MNIPVDQMELREEEIVKHYAAAAAMLAGVDHTPRVARARDVSKAAAKSPGVARTRRFRSTTPGLAGRST
ncbi:MAG: AAA family ATPase, partial [Paracoccaceae bacterium]